MRNRWLLWMSAVLLVSPVAAHAQSGAPAADNPIYVAFQQLEKAPAYHTRITLQSNDPRMAQMAATAFLNYYTAEAKALTEQVRTVVEHAGRALTRDEI